MSVAIMGLVWESSVGPVGKRMVLLALADNADDAGYCWPGGEYLAGKTGLSRSSVFEWISKLEAEGLIQRRARRARGYRAPNAYRINVEAIHRLRRDNLEQSKEEIHALFAPVDNSEPADDATQAEPAPEGDESAGQDLRPESGRRESAGQDLRPESGLTATGIRSRQRPASGREPSVEPPVEPSGVVVSERKVTTRTHARPEPQPQPQHRQPAPTATGDATGSDDYRARRCSMCRLDTDGHTWVRVLDVPGRPPYTPLTVCDHETPLDAIQREVAFLEQHAADQAAASAPEPITLAGPINRGPRPAIRRTTRGTEADRERARVELEQARARVGAGPDPMETPQAMEASG